MREVTVTQDYEMQDVPVNSLMFDTENPRLPSTITTSNEQAVIDWRLKDATIVELMGAIGQKGYFPGEPLLVIEDPNHKQQYIVVEGNRRLTALKLLLNPNLASRLKKSVEQTSVEALYKPKEAPVVIFDKRDQILDYLGYRHITGIKAWSSLAKAKYLAKLRMTLGVTEPQEQYRALAKSIGSRTDYVARMLTGLAVYNTIVENDFFEIEDLEEESIDFSVLTTALSYSHIVKFLALQSNQKESLTGLNIHNLKELTEWLFRKDSLGKTRLGESRNLIELNKIVNNQRALAAFRGGDTLATAYLLTDAPDEIFQNSIGESKARLEAARDTFHKVASVSQNDSENLGEVYKLARNIKFLVDQRLLDDSE